MKYQISSGALILLLLLGRSSAFATETWECSFSSPGSPKNVEGDAQVRIEGSTLNWAISTIKNPLKPDAGTERVSFAYKLLENNPAGIVAVSSQAQLDEHVGPLIGAAVITIKKPSGDLREGSVTANGEPDLLSGHCELKK
ncbi:MAG TPA: hypothetical protein VHE09_12655 [Rhizomicrobium sp.]|jgi:hypothetical protein|nr:hypothetical protein [Rhizomicrobium sp.]